MGMYTAFRARVQVKEEYRDLVQFIYNNRDKSYAFKLAEQAFPDHKFLAEWNSYDSYFPFTWSCYFDGNPYFSDEDDHSSYFEYDGDILEFSCSTKNTRYIVLFVKHVLITITKQLYICFVEYEECQWNFYDGDYAIPKNIALTEIDKYIG